MTAADDFDRYAPAPSVILVEQNAHALKALLAAQRGAMKARTAAVNQIKALLAVAPSELRDRYRRHTSTVTLVRALLRSRPNAYGDATTAAVLAACKALAQRVEFLDRQTLDLTSEFRSLIAEFASATAT